MTRPTRRGLGIAVATVGLWAVGRLLGLDEFYVLAVAAFTALAAAVVAVMFAGGAIAVRRHVSRPRLPAGEQAQVVIELRNESKLGVPVLLGEDHCPQTLLEEPNSGRFVIPGLARDSTVPASYVLHGGLRGRYKIGPLALRIRDPFGLVERTRRYRAVNELVVYPEVEPLPEGTSLGQHSGSGASRSRRLFNAGDEFHTMREYVEGDDLRQVHWPSTAHRQRLMIRQNELPWDTQATLVCDTRALRHHGYGRDSSFERAISAAASVICHLDARNYRTRLVTDQDHRAPLPEDRDALLDRLAVLQTSHNRQLAPMLSQLRSAESQGLLVAILPASEPDDQLQHRDLTALLQLGRAFSGRIAILVATDAPGTEDRPERMAGLLGATNWRTAIVHPGAKLAPAWRDAFAGRMAGATHQGDVS